jgi:hypothetical protein
MMTRDEFFNKLKQAALDHATDFDKPENEQPEELQALQNKLKGATKIGQLIDIMKESGQDQTMIYIEMIVAATDLSLKDADAEIEPGHGYFKKEDLDDEE